MYKLINFFVTSPHQRVLASGKPLPAQLKNYRQEQISQKPITRSQFNN